MGQPSARTTCAANGADAWNVGFSASSLAALRSDMLRFARLQVHDPVLAEDPVQESLESALRNASSFAGDSSLKTWVFAILRNRIIDQHRRASRTINLSSLAADDVGQDECLDALFDAHGDWHPAARPVALADPGRSAEQPTLPCCARDITPGPPGAGQAGLHDAGGAGPGGQGDR